MVVCVLRPGVDRRRRTAGRDQRGRIAAELGKPLKPEAVDDRPRAAEDALGQGHATGDPGGATLGSTPATSARSTTRRASMRSNSWRAGEAQEVAHDR